MPLPNAGGIRGGGKTKMPSKLSKNAKTLRKNATHAENILWNRLRARQIEGLKFRRQQPIENVIVDFVNFEKRVVIEVDGGQHAIEKNKDKKRDRVLKDMGFKILRFWNNEVIENTDEVLEHIRQMCND
jgi:very-short-patch-repair endonuclease